MTPRSPLDLLPELFIVLAFMSLFLWLAAQPIPN